MKDVEIEAFQKGFGVISRLRSLRGFECYGLFTISNQPLRAGAVYNAHILYSLRPKAILCSDCCPSLVWYLSFSSLSC